VTGPIGPDSSDHRAKPRGIGPTEIAVVAAGGVLGSAARYGHGQWWPSPWTVVAINVDSLVVSVRRGHRRCDQREVGFRPRSAGGCSRPAPPL